MEAGANPIDNDTTAWSVLWSRRSEEGARAKGLLITTGFVPRWLGVGVWEQSACQKRGHQLSGRQLNIGKNGGKAADRTETAVGKISVSRGAKGKAGRNQIAMGLVC